MSKNSRETVVFETWKHLLRSTTDTPNRRRIKHKSCSNFERTFDSLMASLIYLKSDFKVPWLGKPV